VCGRDSKRSSKWTRTGFQAFEYARVPSSAWRECARPPKTAQDDPGCCPSQQPGRSDTTEQDGASDAIQVVLRVEEPVDGPLRYDLTLNGPFALIENDQTESVFAVPLAMQSGVYLWIVPYVHGGHLVTYVGETQGSFGRRMKDHIIQTIGGNYRVSDPDSLVQGVDRVLWDGLWRRGTRDMISEYVRRLMDLAPAIQKNLATLRVLVAPLDAERRARQRVEGALANHIRSQPPPASALLPRDIRYYGRRVDEAPIVVGLSCGVEVLGLPTAFEA
jgi:hypothetical protein